MPPTHDSSRRGPSGTPPQARHKPSEGPPKDPAAAAAEQATPGSTGHDAAPAAHKAATHSGPTGVPTPPTPVDSELIEDLGAEFALRGDQLEAELEALRVESAEYRDRAMRAAADFDNFRKRTQREREDEKRRAGERLVAEMLPAMDNLERAIAHAEGGGDLKHLLGGVEAVYQQLLGVLGKEGVEVIDPTGEPFDPMTQQAVSQVENADVPEGTVVDVFQKGYAIGDRVIRSAMVVVSTGGPAARG